MRIDAEAAADWTRRGGVAPVNEEEAFQAALDASPEDHQARLVFADWLQERDDPRAEGYRAMGSLKRFPHYTARDCISIQPGRKACAYWWLAPGNRNMADDPRFLPGDWFAALEVEGKHDGVAPAWDKRTDATRRELEDAAALAFSKLPPERREELLTGKK